jgi:hypothetical protein
MFVEIIKKIIDIDYDPNTVCTILMGGFTFDVLNVLFKYNPHSTRPDQMDISQF